MCVCGCFAVELHRAVYLSVLCAMRVGSKLREGAFQRLWALPIASWQPYFLTLTASLIALSTKTVSLSHVLSCIQSTKL